MACGSGCCSPPQEAMVSNRPRAIEAEEISTDGCCASTKSINDERGETLPNHFDTGAPDIVAEASCIQGCYSSTKALPSSVTSLAAESAALSPQEEVCEKGCCSRALQKPRALLKSPDTCCSPAPTGTLTKGCYAREETQVVQADAVSQLDDRAPARPLKTTCEKKCCSKATLLYSKRSDAPPCCEGKAAPCCNSDCIERLALRECKDPSSVSCSSLESDDEQSAKPQQPKERTGTPCAGHVQKVKRRWQERLEALGCICRTLIALGQETCCAPSQSSSSSKGRSLRSPSPKPSIDSCCAPGVACTSAAKAGNESKISCADSCCGGSESDAIIETVEVAAKVAHSIDLEKGISGREHVIISISGMTCTGCETKLRRTLGTLNTITNLKTSLVLARAEFDLDSQMAAADDIIKHLERTTEFKCERVTNQGSSIDLICTSDATTILKGPWPDGVIDIRSVDKKIVRAEYDAKVVGARNLFEKGWDIPMTLAPPRHDPTLDAGSRHVRHMGLMTILSAVLTIPVLVMAWAPLPKREVAYGSASLALATIVQVVIAGPFYPKALKDLIFSRTVEMDLLIVLSTSAAYIFSVVSFSYLVAGKPLSTGEFFETSTLLVTIIMVGRFVSALARQKAAESISIRSLQASTAILVDKEGGEREIDTRLLQYGDNFKVFPDCWIPTDGTVISGSSEVDESMITGESMPVGKHPKSSVIAGSINGSGTLVVRLTRLPGDNTISTIATMVDEAKLSKPKIQDIADRIASYFVPVIVVLAIITFVIWIAVGVAVRSQSGSEATIQALTYAITVLIVSCPCAIGLAVPMVIVIASGVAAQRGVIFKSANSIELAYKTTDVIFDKTGTLTKGELAVSHEEYLINSVAGVNAKSLLLGLVGGIKHPVSTAITSHLKAAGIKATMVQDPKSIPAKGVEGLFRGQTLQAGNSRWTECSKHQRVQAVLSRGLTALCFTVDEALVAVYGLEDTLRSDATSTVAALQAAGIAVHVLSGDEDGAVRNVTAPLKIPNANVRSRFSPADKQAYVQDLLKPRTTSSSNTMQPIVVFCGDGTNDAVALTQATIGIHISTGTDVAQSAADVVLMRPSLSDILTMIAISKKAIHRIAFNFTWSFVYNLFAVLLGAGAFVHARIPPEFAGLGELVSVLPVIAIAVALRWTKI